MFRLSRRILFGFSFRETIANGNTEISLVDMPMEVVPQQPGRRNLILFQMSVCKRKY